MKDYTDAFKATELERLVQWLRRQEPQAPAALEEVKVPPSLEDAYAKYSGDHGLAQIRYPLASLLIVLCGAADSVGVKRTYGELKVDMAARTEGERSSADTALGAAASFFAGQGDWTGALDAVSLLRKTEVDSYKRYSFLHSFSWPGVDFDGHKVSVDVFEGLCNEKLGDLDKAMPLYERGVVSILSDRTKSQAFSDVGAHSYEFHLLAGTYHAKGLTEKSQTFEPILQAEDAGKLAAEKRALEQAAAEMEAMKASALAEKSADALRARMPKYFRQLDEIMDAWRHDEIGSSTVYQQMAVALTAIAKIQGLTVAENAEIINTLQTKGIAAQAGKECRSRCGSVIIPIEKASEYYEASDTTWPRARLKNGQQVSGRMWIAVEGRSRVSWLPRSAVLRSENHFDGRVVA